MASITQWWVTTTDNPYDPFTDFTNWYQFDEFEKRYHTAALMDRLSTCPFDAPEAFLQESNQRAVGIIMRDIPLLVDGVEYKPVTRTINIDE